jgi:demethylmenaquinone methyltransferase/2-methoxy-6-polyprenyl-1,4-benzoquinol methylase
MREMMRVAKRRAVVLEFVRPPRGPVGSAYRLYLRTLLPAVGGAISGQPSAYRYLSDTVDSYRTPEELIAMAAAAGWHQPRIRLLALGTVAVLVGDKKDSA